MCYIENDLLDYLQIIKGKSLFPEIGFEPNQKKPILISVADILTCQINTTWGLEQSKLRQVLIPQGVWSNRKLGLLATIEAARKKVTSTLELWGSMTVVQLICSCN